MKLIKKILNWKGYYVGLFMINAFGVFMGPIWYSQAKKWKDLK